MGTAYPLVFTYRVTVQGARYLAGVEFRGGAVVTVEPDGAYLAHGLQPGGVAGQGVTLREAYHDLEQSIELVLYDLADAAPDLDAFSASVRQFFDDTDPWAERAFASAREDVAAGRIESDLPKVPQPTFSAKVVEFVQPSARNNPAPTAVEIAA